MTGEIKAFAEAWDSAFNAGDMAKLAGFYAERPVVVPAGDKPVEGQEAVGAFFADVRAQGLTTHRIDVQAVIDRGETVIAHGTWSLIGATDGGGALKFGGNWVNVLARDGGTWKILLHTWN